MCEYPVSQLYWHLDVLKAVLYKWTCSGHIGHVPWDIRIRLVFGIWLHAVSNLVS